LVINPKLMKNTKGYQLYIKIHLERASLAQTGKAIGMLCKKYLTPRLISCTAERANDQEATHQAETVIKHLMGRPSLWSQAVEGIQPDTRALTLDDVRVNQLAQKWDKAGAAEHMIVVPHMFYAALLKCFVKNLELRAPEILREVVFFFDYAALDGVHEVVRRSFLGERTAALNYLKEEGFSFIDSGRRLFLENLISLACYMIPAKYLVFMDDDFFISKKTVIDQLLEPLRRGYLLSGRYVSVSQRMHTSLFALRPGCLRDELLLFDSGENLYANASLSTGSITYQELKKRGKGVFSIGDYADNDDTFGRHLGHCTTELWSDLPQVLKTLFQPGNLAAKDARIKMNVDILLEALALLYKVPRKEEEYCHVDNDLRWKAPDNFPVYLGKIYNNHRWLLRHGASLYGSVQVNVP